MKPTVSIYGLVDNRRHIRARDRVAVAEARRLDQHLGNGEDAHQLVVLGHV